MQVQVPHRSHPLAKYGAALRFLVRMRPRLGPSQASQCSSHTPPKASILDHANASFWLSGPSFPLDCSSLTSRFRRSFPLLFHPLSLPHPSHRRHLVIFSLSLSFSFLFHFGSVVTPSGEPIHSLGTSSFRQLHTPSNPTCRFRTESSSPEPTSTRYLSISCQIQ